MDYSYLQKKNLLSVDGNLGHPFGSIVADVLHDELEDQLQQLVHVIGRHHRDVAAVLRVHVVWTALPPGGQVRAEEGQDDVDDVGGLGVRLALLDELVHLRDERVQRGDALFQTSSNLCNNKLLFQVFVFLNKRHF